jgi:tetratricopeptide (TPR) repeat protein
MVAFMEGLLVRPVRLAFYSCVLALVATCSHADEVQKHFDAGVKLYEAHKTADALAEFHLALKGAPKDATILRWIGFLEMSRRNYEAAREPLERAAALDPTSVVAHLNLGDVYDGLKLYPKALSEFRQVIKLKPDSADAYYDMGRVYTTTDRWPEAVEALKSAAKLESARAAAGGPKEDPAIQDSLGYALMNDNDIRGAITAFQRAAALAPENAEFAYHVGLAWWRAAEAKKAPRDTALANARRALKIAVERAPDNYEYAERYAEVLLDMNSDAEAAEEFRRAAELDKSQYAPVSYMAYAYFRMGRFADAEKGYARALTLVKPGDDPSGRRNALIYLSISLIRQKRYDEALNNLKTCTTEFPGEVDGWIDLASVYRSKGDAAGEVEALRRGVANVSGFDNLRLRTSLGALLFRRGDMAGAFEQYSLANRARPFDPDILNGLALAEEKLGKTDDAIRDYQAAIKARPRFADAYNNLGVAYEARYRVSKDKADRDRALSAYNEALAIDPHHEFARKNRERFDRAGTP